MEPAVLLVAGGALFAAAYAYLRNARARAERWRQAAAVLGLKLSADPVWGELAMIGELEGRTVAVRFSGGRASQIIIDVVHRGEPFDLDYRVGPALFGGLDAITTGDEDFDFSYGLKGDAATLAAVLSSGVRRDLLELQVRHVHKTATVRIDEDAEMGKIVAVVKRTLALAKTLEVEPHEVAKKLAEKFASEPHVAVRRWQLGLLLATQKSEARTRSIELALTERFDPECRLMAAKEAGERGREVMKQIAFENRAPDLLRARALKDLPRGAVELSQCERMKAHPTSFLRAAAAERLAELEVEGEGEKQRVERALLELLDDEHAEVKMAAMAALEKVGSAAAVEPLLAIADGGFFATRMRSDARRAIGAIQSRLGGTRGELALIEKNETSGALSHPAESGALSLEDGASKDG